MRRACIIALALLLVLAVGQSGLAEPALQTVDCPEEGYTTKCPAGWDWYYTPDGGMTFYKDLDSPAPGLTVSYTVDAPEFDVDGYFENAFTPRMRQAHGEGLNADEVDTYNISGIEMRGVLYAWPTEDGRFRVCLCLFELQGDNFVRYEADYYLDDSGDTLTLLDTVALFFNPKA